MLLTYWHNIIIVPPNYSAHLASTLSFNSMQFPKMMQMQHWLYAKEDCLPTEGCRGLSLCKRRLPQCLLWHTGSSEGWRLSGIQLFTFWDDYRLFPQQSGCNHSPVSAATTFTIPDPPSESRCTIKIMIPIHHHSHDPWSWTMIHDVVTALETMGFLFPFLSCTWHIFDLYPCIKYLLEGTIQFVENMHRIVLESFPFHTRKCSALDSSPEGGFIIMFT